MANSHTPHSCTIISRMIPTMILCLSALMMPTESKAENLQDHFQQANGAYWEERYDDAIEMYTRMIGDYGIENATLSYNLGTTYGRATQSGKAVLWLKRALKQDPTPELRQSAEANLAATHAALVERYRTELPEEQFVFAAPHSIWYRIFHLTSATTARWAFAGSTALFFILLGMLRLRASGLKAGRSLAIILALISIGSGIMYFGHMETDKNTITGVVTTPNILLREGKHPSAPTHPLPEGLEVQILDSSDDELTRIQLSNRRAGWVPKTAVEAI